MPKSKYYVVWQGKKPGIYLSWTDCLAQTKGVKDARFKAFDNRQQAEEAFARSYKDYIVKKNTRQGPPKASARDLRRFPEIVLNSLSVDAACAGNPGVMEYRGVETGTGRQLFIRKFEEGTNNIGEFLALVHGLALLKKHGSQSPVYSDSRIAINWVLRDKRCKTNLKPNARNEALFKAIAGAEQWLRENRFTNDIRKWETKKWGEIPADFGRK